MVKNPKETKWGSFTPDYNHPPQWITLEEWRTMLKESLAANPDWGTIEEIKSRARPIVEIKNPRKTNGDKE